MENKDLDKPLNSQEGVFDNLILRFDGENEDGTKLHELKASHVADVLEGLVELAQDFEKAGVFHELGPGKTEILVRPAKEGSFILEIVQVATENPELTVAAAGAIGFPPLSKLIEWSTKSARAKVADFEHLENGNVKIFWQDNTAEEVPEAAWKELNKSPRRRKKQLRKIMAPLEDDRVNKLEVKNPDESVNEDTSHEETYTLNKADFVSVKPEEEIEESYRFFDIEARMGAIDFDDPAKWRIKTKEKSRTATMEDQDFLDEVARGLAISKDDVFILKIREDRIVKNGRTRLLWTVLKVK